MGAVACDGCPDASRPSPYPLARVAEIVDEVHPPDEASPALASARRYTTYAPEASGRRGANSNSRHSSPSPPREEMLPL